MAVHSLSVIVDDVPAAAAFLQAVMGWRIVGEVDDGFAELDTGDASVMLSATGPVPMPQVGGVILHDVVEEVDAAAARATAAGGVLLYGPVDMDFGMRSALVQGPHGLVLDLCRPVDPPPGPGA
ncbi:VOC family protein [uncultured Friedmanniella sp.]|uniref:VOC family protein n=1 Tax=uncultured Friedmanniella sp. TaxID=335381 RepID=UPI0035CBC42B